MLHRSILVFHIVLSIPTGNSSGRCDRFSVFLYQAWRQFKYLHVFVCLCTFVLGDRLLPIKTACLLQGSHPWCLHPCTKKRNSQTSSLPLNQPIGILNWLQWHLRTNSYWRISCYPSSCSSCMRFQETTSRCQSMPLLMIILKHPMLVALFFYRPPSFLARTPIQSRRQNQLSK